MVAVTKANSITTIKKVVVSTNGLMEELTMDFGLLVNSTAQASIKTKEERHGRVYGNTVYKRPG